MKDLALNHIIKFPCLRVLRISRDIKRCIKLLDKLGIVTTIESKHLVSMQAINCLGDVLETSSGVHRRHIKILMLENSCLVVQHTSIVDSLLLSPKPKRISTSGLLVGIGTEEKWLVFAPFEDGTSSRNI